MDEKGKAMGEFTIQIDVDAPQRAVLEYIADGTRTPEWYEAVRRATKTTEGRTAKGTRYEFTRALPQGRVVNNLELTLRPIVRHGGAIGVCGTCMDARGITEAELADGCHRSTMHELTDWTERADQVLVF